MRVYVPGTTRTCCYCKQEKPADEFHWRNKERGTRAAGCKPCSQAKSKRWYHENRERALEQQRKTSRERHLKYLYGLSEERYAEMLEQQGGVCAICSSSPEDTRHGVLYVDHDHSTGSVRSLLCEMCNHGLGRFLDKPELLRRAADYLESQ